MEKRKILHYTVLINKYILLWATHATKTEALLPYLYIAYLVMTKNSLRKMSASSCSRGLATSILLRDGGGGGGGGRKGVAGRGVFIVIVKRPSSCLSGRWWVSTLPENKNEKHYGGKTPILL